MNLSDSALKNFRGIVESAAAKGSESLGKATGETWSVETVAIQAGPGNHSHPVLSGGAEDD